jgi:hypothetical protein
MEDRVLSDRRLAAALRQFSRWRPRTLFPLATFGLHPQSHKGCQRWGLVAATATYWILGRRLSCKANQIGRCQDNPSVVVRAFVRRVMRSCLVIKAGLKAALDWAALAGRLHCAMLRYEKGYSNGYSRLTAPGAKRPVETVHCIGVPGNGSSVSGQELRGSLFQRLRVQVAALTAPTGASPSMILATC